MRVGKELLYILTIALLLGAMSLLTVGYYQERDTRITAQVSLRVQTMRHEAEVKKLQAEKVAREVERDIQLQILHINGLGYSPSRRAAINQARERAGEAPLPEIEVKGAVGLLQPPQLSDHEGKP